MLMAAQYTNAGEMAPDVSWLNQKNGPRPKYVWENREDTIYHEMWYPDTNKITAPEFWTIMREPWVFNRAMRWVEPGDGTMVAYSEGGPLRLTGEQPAGRWYSEPANEIATEGESVRFSKKTDGRRRDCAVRPLFQFHVGQHPVLRLSVADASAEWQFVASLKGRSGAPFISSGWQTGAKTMEFDLAQKLRELGYAPNYAETSIYLGAKIHRQPKPQVLDLEFMNVPEGLSYTLYDLTSKRVELQGQISRSKGISLPATSHDYLLVAGGSHP